MKLFTQHSIRIESKSFEYRVAKACEAYRAAENPKIAKIARENSIARETLRDRVRKGLPAQPTLRVDKRALHKYKEEAVIR